MSILVLNAGSSTLKFVLFADSPAEELVSGTVDWKSNATQASIALHVADGTARQETAAVHGFADAVGHALRLVGAVQPLTEVRVCGHRVVHGGERFSSSVRIDVTVRQAIDALSELAPLHNPARWPPWPRQPRRCRVCRTWRFSIRPFS